jgi:choline dehydrogenase-like flavoprotein
VASKDIADVLIIGSGASAGPFACHLSSARGLRIVCLEQGGWVGKPPAGAGEAAGQRKRLVTPPAPQQGVRSFPDGYPYDYSESYWQPILGNAVGGATIHYGAVWARLHPSDFVVHSIDGVADDWPISYWDLAPYYDMNDRKVGVAGVAGNPGYPPKSVDFLPPHKLSRTAEILIRGFEKLGWHWWPSERAVVTVPFAGRNACVSNCVRCDDGCPREAKNSSDVVHWPEAIRNGVVMKTRSRVREITVNQRGLVDGALYYDADGHLQKQLARVVVVACNGIGTPRLLLNSKSNRFPQGLANGSGMVGKNLMGHNSARVAALFENDNTAETDLLTNGIASEQFYESEPNRGFARGFHWLSTGYLGPVYVAQGGPPTTASTVIPAVLGPRTVPIAWGSAHHEAFQERASHTLGLGVSGEELPDEGNRVELHPTLTDDFGIPAPKLIYRRTENNKKILAYGMERSRELLLAAGATKIVSAEFGTAAPGHYMGTARMGSDPMRSVVDRWCRAHEVKNLFVIDGSVFTTSGAVVPTSTIQAIALRAADYIKRNLTTVLS